MDDLNLCLRVILGTIFFTAGYSKVRRIGEHMVILEEYRLLPTAWIKPIGRVEIILELLTGGLLLLGIFQNLASILASGLLMLYCFAISVNLLRGRREISCGCGGVTGNHSLSWFLVFRNIILLLGSIWLYKHPTTIGSVQALLLSDLTIGDVYSSHFFLIVLNSYVYLLIGMSFVELFKVYFQINPKRG
jgi:uncharacterized membrane protein YphA (DoxX/SURF4 family)